MGNLPNFTGNTNPFMPCYDSHGNYIYKITIGNFSEK